MNPRGFALVGGIVMLIVGLVALLPNMVGPTEGLPALLNQQSYGAFLDYFPMNIYNKVALILFGISGIVAAQARFTSLPKSIQFSRFVLYIMGALAILGLFPQTNTLGGYWPLFGGDMVLHAVFAVLGGYFGYALSAKVPDSGPAIKNFTSSPSTSMRGSR